MKCIWKTFADLANNDVYEILRLRQNIFIVEQQSPYADIDGKDLNAMHLLMKRDLQLIACCRVLPPDEHSDLAAIGRVVVAQGDRGKGIGHQLLSEATAFCIQTYTGSNILIRAQSHLASFYKHHGFERTGVEYVEDGIPHMELIRTFDPNK